MKHLLALLILCVGSRDLGAQSFTLWNESVNGPLGENPPTATHLSSLSIGTNILIGTAQIEPIGSSWLIRPDCFQVDIPPSLRVTAIFISVDKPNLWSFLGTSDYNTAIGFTPNSVSGNLLSQFGLTSIEPGSYGMYVENHDRQAFPVIANYQIDFVVNPVPEPSTWALLGLGSVLLWSAVRRRNK